MLAMEVAGPSMQKEAKGRLERNEFFRDCLATKELSLKVRGGAGEERRDFERGRWFRGPFRVESTRNAEKLQFSQIYFYVRVPVCAGWGPGDASQEP